MIISKPHSLQPAQAAVQICFGEPLTPRKFERESRREMYNGDYTTLMDSGDWDQQTGRCGCPIEDNARLDPATGECVPCPQGSESKMNGLYCQRCPPGAEEARLPFTCRACKPGFFKAENDHSECQPCKSSTADDENAEWGSVGC